jgi:hypothetical protein
MLKKQDLSKTLLCILLGSFLIFGAASNGFAGEPPPAGSTIAGKSESGVFTVVTIMIENFPVAVTSIVGECGSGSFVVGPAVNNPIEPDGISGIVASDLEDQYLKDADSYGCYTHLETDDLVITRARNFINTGDAISADVTIRAVIPAP